MNTDELHISLTNQYSNHKNEKYINAFLFNTNKPISLFHHRGVNRRYPGNGEAFHSLVLILAKKLCDETIGAYLKRHH